MANNNGSNSTTKQRSIVIAERDNISAVIDDGRVTEFFIHRGDMLLGDVYLATIENILPSIDAAFVNLGADRMGFLHASDVPGKGDLKDRIEPKQRILVQIMKEPTGHKGPRVSTSLSLPGRFIVLMPEEKGISISRKILSPKERSRLKSIVSLVKPAGVGVIIRTEAENQSDEEIKEDLEICLEKWQNIVTTADSVDPPTLIHRDQDLLYRVIRESCNDVVKEITIDSAFGQHRVNQLIQTWNLSKEIKVSVHKGTDSLIVNKGLDKEIKQALQSKVHLPSGGYLFIQTTEALTVIDVNSGRFTSSQTQGETIRQTNLEALDEIARQLRLRNVGGMIIVDFIDMDNRVDQLAILEAFESALLPDKAKPQVGQLSDLGLVELTRHRQGQSLFEIFTKKCPACGGTGNVLEDLTFAPAPMEGELRQRAQKSKMVPRMKSAMSQSRADLAKGQKALKERQKQMKPGQGPGQGQGQGQKPVNRHMNKPAQRPTAQQKAESAPKPKEAETPALQMADEVEPPKPALEQSPEATPDEPETLYFKTEKDLDIEQLTVENMRKTLVKKKFYPELSKIVRFTGVPLKYARENFGETVNMVDVFTILDEMEAAFARAASEPVSHKVPRSARLDGPPVPKLSTRDTLMKEAKEFEKESNTEDFQGQYGVLSDGENFEELYDEFDEEKKEETVETGETEQPKEETKDKPETSENEEQKTDEAETAETANKPAPRKRTGRKPASGRKRGRPRSK